jgi:hypothetical protein
MVTRPTEQFVEEAVIAQCATAGIPSLRGVEVDDLGERASLSAMLLSSRLRAAERVSSAELALAGGKE